MMLAAVLLAALFGVRHEPPLSMAAAQLPRTATTVAAMQSGGSAAALQTLSFSEALDRALRTHGAVPRESSVDFSFRKLPSVRAETGFSSAEDLNLITQNVTRIDAFTALINVDYPLLDGGAAERHRAAVKLRAQRPFAEADQVFRETLDAFAQLYTADRRMEILRDGAVRATGLRDRSRTMLEAGQISNVVAAQWQEQALATESTLVDLELQRLDAETRLKQLIGDTSDEPLHVTLDRVSVPGPDLNDADVQRAHLALQDALALRKPQLMMSAFGGVADVQDGTFGLYGLRFSLTLPMFDAAAARRVAEAKLDVEEAQRGRSVAEAAHRNRIDLLRVAIHATEKRIALVTRAIDVAKRREESLIRLIRAGVRPEADLVDVTSGVFKHESDLVSLEVELWKFQQQLAWSGANRAPGQPGNRATTGQ